MSIADLNLDAKTLEFAIHQAWCFEFLCKDTKNGRIKANAYQTIQSDLKYYLDNIDSAD